MNLENIVNGILVIIGLLTVAIIFARLVAKVIWKIFSKQSSRQQANNQRKKRDAGVNPPNDIEEQGKFTPPLTNKRSICPTNPIPNLKYRNNYPLSEYSSNVVNRPFDIFSFNEIEHFDHSPKSTIRETQLTNDCHKVNKSR
jgi:hypothetical protein